MAAEIPPAAPGPRGPPAGFNEAAANGRGNLADASACNAHPGRASMRPRRMAAEIQESTSTAEPSNASFNEAAANGRGNRAARRGRTPPTSCFNEAAANGRGNHLRRRDGFRALPGFNEAAANGRGNRCSGRVDDGACSASMRPRRMAAEIARIVFRFARSFLASMRPRRMAAEISRRRALRAGRQSGFNEAAANGRGNRGEPAVGQREPAAASMRPRRMAAEIAGAVEPRPARRTRFNEAAANGRGNHDRRDPGGLLHIALQ